MIKSFLGVWYIIIGAKKFRVVGHTDLLTGDKPTDKMAYQYAQMFADVFGGEIYLDLNN